LGLTSRDKGRVESKTSKDDDLRMKNATGLVALKRKQVRLQVYAAKVDMTQDNGMP